VFVPYAAANIYEVYRSGKDLNSVLETRLFRHIRDWQDGYGFAATKASETGNWLMPCAIRDHFGHFHKGIANGGGTPIDSEAEAAMTDKDYYEGMVKYGQEYQRLTGQLWRDEYLASGSAEKEEPKKDIARTA
jgi:hypothetical protein